MICLQSKLLLCVVSVFHW